MLPTDKAPVKPFGDEPSSLHFGFQAAVGVLHRFRAYPSAPSSLTVGKPPTRYILGSLKRNSRAPQPKKTTAKPLNPKAKSKAADAPRKQPKTVLSVQHGGGSAERDRNLTNDTLWLFGLVATCYSAIALLTFHMSDPSWSRSVPHLGMVKILAGLLGAYLADIAYYLFGFSAWWCIIAAGVALYRTFRPLVDAGMPPYKKINASIGLGMMLIASPVLEAFAFNAHLDKSLPFGAGGLVGSLTAAGMNHMLGRVGGTFVLVILILLSLSFIVQISWLDFMEKLGVQLERFFRAVFSQKDRLMQPEIIAETKLQPRVLAEVENIIAEPVAQKISSTSPTAARLPSLPSGSLKTASTACPT